MAAHRHLDIHICRQLEANYIAGIRPCKNVRLLEVQSGGPENLGCLPKDCRNFIEERRRLRLGDGDLRRSLYNERQRWVHVFWAGMISTQHSEGMHAFFDDFFVEQYDIAIGNKIQKEFQADFQSKNNQFQKVYTNSIFSLVQDQINRMLYCHVVPPTVDEQIADSNDIGIERYMVLERSILNDFFLKEFTYTVEWRPLGAYISCNCRKFKFKGILCFHTMTVLAQNDIQTVNERYLLHRWRKDVNHRHSSIFFAGGCPHMIGEYKKFQEVDFFFQQCADAAMESTGKMEYIKEMYIDMKNELINWNSGSTTTHADPSIRTSQSLGGALVLDPNVAVPRGRPRTQRFVSASEARGCGRGGRHTSDATRISGRGGRRVSGATRGIRGCNSRGGSRVASGPTHGDNNNDNEFLFDLNEDLNASQASFIF
ncbi:hypothetical protein ACS0TY_014352 [Phlomoides rotata]